MLPKINDMDYINKEIYIVQFPEGKNLSFSEGIIKNIDDNELVYDASTRSGSSGSPIILKNSIEVIGIHKQGNLYKKENYGNLMKSILNMLNDDKKDNIEFKKDNINKLYENGDYYIGEMLNDKPHGKGKKYNKKGELIYAGDIVNGKAEGYGIHIFKDGRYYMGQWKNNHQNGKGILYSKDGELIYEGDFVNGEMEGYGKYIFENIESFFEQYLESITNNKDIGFFKKFYILSNFDKVKSNGKINNFIGIYYIGQFVYNLPHGKGTIYYKNGKILYVKVKWKEMENFSN